MWRKLFFYFIFSGIAFGILFISILRTAAVRYEVSLAPSGSASSQVLTGEDVFIDYDLASPGSVLPDHPLWMLKAARDRVWLLITTDQIKKAELNLLIADKRLGAAEMLFENEKPEEALTSLTKGERYLAEASYKVQEVRRSGDDTSELLVRLANASLKHWQVMQNILELAPEQVRPLVIQLQDYPVKVFRESVNALNQKGVTAPENPFDW